MELGFVGLGKMGFNMTTRLLEFGQNVVATDLNPNQVQALQDKGATGASSMQDLIAKLSGPRKAVWIMVPSGIPTEQSVLEALKYLKPGDIIVDGGNSNFEDTKRRYGICKEKGVHFIDAGTSGGVWGLQIGYALMVGGDDDAVHYLEPIFKALAPEGGYFHCGPSGAGHYVKMVHNGIEYAMLAAYGEGYDILENSQYNFDLLGISKMWQNGSVIRSWLLDLAVRAFEQEGNELGNIRGYVEDSGEGRWTVKEAIDQSTPAPVITLALLSRFVSRQPESFSAKVIAALRNQFGGHAIMSADPGGGAEDEANDDNLSVTTRIVDQEINNLASGSTKAGN